MIRRFDRWAVDLYGEHGKPAREAPRRHDVERGVPDEHGYGLCVNKRCRFWDESQPLHATRACGACCPRWYAMPGECADCAELWVDPTTGEPVDDDEDD